MTITEIKNKLSKLEDLFWVNREPRMVKLRNEILKEREPEINNLKEELKKLQSKKSKPKERVPENTPDNILKICEKYWSGTEEYYKFRIHSWNDKAVWTSYAAGSYGTNGGRVAHPAAYYMLSLTETGQAFGGIKPKVLKEFNFEIGSGKKVTAKMMQEELDKL